jgi:hypothetical protein
MAISGQSSSNVRDHAFIRLWIEVAKQQAEPEVQA